MIKNNHHSQIPSSAKSSKPKETTRPVIAITGATGFVGQHVLKKLLDDGFRVKALIRTQSLHKAFEHENLNWIEGTISQPRPLRALCAGAHIVIHLAGLITARTKDEYFECNARAVAVLTNIAAKANVERFIYLSSLAAREPRLSNYAASKRAGEGAMARRVGKAMKGVAVRSPAVFGPGDEATAPLMAMIKRGVLLCPGGRGWRARKLSLLYIDDLVDFLSGPCLSGAYDGRTISPSTRANVTWPQFANECTQALGKPVRTLAIPLTVLYPVAAITSLTKQVFDKGHLTGEKLREFLHADWSVEGEFQSETDLQSALKVTINAL